jgi:hypothetical protein
MKKLGEGFALAVAELEGEKAAGFEGLVGLGDEAAVDVEAVGAGEEGLSGFVLADLRVEVGCFRDRNVRRVADDGVEVAVLLGGWEGGEEVGEEEADAGGEVVGGGVGFGDGQGFGGEVERGDLGLREVGGERDGDGSGAGADVGDGDGPVVWEALEDGFDEVLGLGAGDEDGRSDAEGETVELLGASDVLDGLV